MTFILKAREPHEDLILQCRLCAGDDCHDRKEFSSFVSITKLSIELKKI